MTQREFASEVVEAIIDTFHSGIENEWNMLDDYGPDRQSDEREIWTDVVEEKLNDVRARVEDLP